MNKRVVAIFKVAYVIMSERKIHLKSAAALRNPLLFMKHSGDLVIESMFFF